MKPTYPESLKWLPDWTDPRQYPPVEGTPGTQWAWEFLRRNPEYREAYSKLTHVTCMEEFSRLWNIAEKFHLADGLYPPDPESSQDPHLSFRANWIRSYRHSERHPEHTITIPPGKVLIEFDTSLPFADQLRNAKEILKRAGSPCGAKFRASNFPVYLRVLDARSECDPPSFETIGKCLYPESFEPASVAAKAHDTAITLRDSLFPKIPLI